jgi:hypothetical protein
MDRFRIKPEYLSSCVVEYHRIDEYDVNIYGTYSTIDHPSFTALREHLGSKGWIRIKREWLNGDVVLKPFELNGHRFEIGDQFSTAGALGISLNREAKRTPKKPILEEELFNV